MKSKVVGIVLAVVVILAMGLSGCSLTGTTATPVIPTVSNVAVTNNQIVVTYTDNTTKTLTGVVGPQGPQGPQGPAGAAGSAGAIGASVSTAAVNTSGHLIITLTGGATVDAGAVVGPAGPAGTSVNTLSVTSVLSATNFVIRVNNPLTTVQPAMFKVTFWFNSPYDLTTAPTVIPAGWTNPPTNYSQAFGNYLTLSPQPVSSIGLGVPILTYVSSLSKWFVVGVQFDSMSYSLPAGVTSGTFTHALNSTACYLTVEVVPVATTGTGGTGTFS